MSLPSGGGRDLLPLRARLFAPGQRLGWIFRDRRWAAVPFREPPPLPRQIPPGLLAERRDAARRLRVTARIAVLVAAGVLVLLALLGGCAAALPGSVPVRPFLVFGLILAAPGGVVTAVMAAHRASAVRAVERAKRESAADHEQRHVQWVQRRLAHERADLARVEALDEWGAARTPPGTRRLDIFGGSLHGWEAFLTVYGTSTMAERPLLVADLSRELVCRELVTIAAAAGAPADVQLLPGQAADSTVLSGLPGHELAEALTEAIHQGDAPDSRARRAIDGRILAQVCGALAEPVSVARVAAALRALLGERDGAGPLTAAERATLAGGLFTAAYQREVRADLVRIESYLHPLAGLGAGGPAAGPRDPAYLTCIALQPGARSGRDELIGALAAHWLTYHVTATAAQVPAVVIAGADELSRRQLERLSDACERRGVLLTLLFRHLREGAVQLLGGGAAGFMRLGNHEEAARAADFIGRRHKFVLSQLTSTLGGDETHTTQVSAGQTERDRIDAGAGAGWLTALRPAGLAGIASKLRAARPATSRTWTTAYARAAASDWSDARSAQRVYEYAVEPTVLQHLPDYALLLVTPGRDGGPAITPVECNPEIVTLPRVSTQPLSDVTTVPAVPVTPPPAAGWPQVPGGAWPPAAVLLPPGPPG